MSLAKLNEACTPMGGLAVRACSGLLLPVQMLSGLSSFAQKVKEGYTAVGGK